jgi:hypothetical protein
MDINDIFASYCELVAYHHNRWPDHRDLTWCGETIRDLMLAGF